MTQIQRMKYDMKIYRSTQHIEDPQVGDLQLDVNSMWDFGSRNVCYETIDSTFGGGKTTIAYDLKKCIEVKDSFVVGSNPPRPCKQTRWEKAEITPEIVSKLIDSGYSMSRDYLVDQCKCQSYEEDGKLVDCTCGKCSVKS